MNEVTLEFLAERFADLANAIAEQQKMILDRLGTIEDQQTVLTGIVMRLDGSLGGLVTELRGMYRLLERLEHRMRKVEGS